jgi:uncharacterized protein
MPAPAPPAIAGMCGAMKCIDSDHGCRVASPAKLLDVHPGGFAQRLCDGMARLRYRDGFGAERLVTPGEAYEVEIRMWDTCVRLPAGHRLRVEIASSAFPKFDLNLGTGGGMITETEGVIATNRLWHTPSRPSRLIVN